MILISCLCYIAVEVLKSLTKGHEFVDQSSQVDFIHCNMFALTVENFVDFMGCKLCMNRPFSCLEQYK